MTYFAVDTHQLLNVVWVSLVAGLGVSVLFSLVIVAGARAGEARRTGDDGAAAGYALLTAVAFLLFAGGVVLGVHAMVTK